MESSQGRPVAVFWGVAVVSLSVLVLQLAITRIFSATMYYHYAFLAVSLALFGSGASGVLVYLAGHRLDTAQSHRWLTLCALLFASTTLAALFVVLRYPLSPTAALHETIVRLACIYAAVATPFICAGAVISLAVTHYAPHINRLYLFDLCGAAAGCLALVPLLNALGAVNTVLGVAVLAAAAACLFASSGSRSRVLSLGAPVALVALLNLLAHNVATRRIDVRAAKGHSETGHVVFAKWNSFSRVTVWGSLAGESLLVMIDADAATAISRHGRDLERHAYLRGSIESLVYNLRPRARTLIIGAGAGKDVIAARLFDACPIDAVEVNPIIARDIMSSEPFRTYSGALYEQPCVRLIVDEGRSFVRGSNDVYDVIQGTMVDTWAATAAGAYALTENNLYTVEAFRDYTEHLAVDGVLSMTRWHMEPSDQLLRLVSLARAAMPSSRRRDAAWQIMILHAPWEGGDRAAATFLFKKSPFRIDEVRQVEQLAGRDRLTLLYTPLTRPDNDFTRLITASDPATVWRAHRSNIAPTWDNSPFFFQSARFDRLADVSQHGAEWRKTNLGTLVLCVLLTISVVVTTSFILGPLALARRRARAVGTSSKLAYLAYFGCLGAAFMIVEMALVQKSILFLGHPTYSLTVVLFSLLCASGVGSAFCGRFREQQIDGRLRFVLTALTATIVVYILALSPLLYGLVHLHRIWRIATVVALLLPLGFVMGMPMPTGIRILRRAAPELIPWAWGVNGAMSVLGSVAALVIALLAGFNQALLVAASLYLLAMVCIGAATWRRAPV